MGFDSREYSYADVKVSILGTQLTGLRGLTYKEKVDKELVYAEGNKPRAIQSKNVSYEGTLMVLKSDFDALTKAAVAAGYRSLLQTPGGLINIVCVYQKTGSTSLSISRCVNVEFTEYEDGMKQGDSFKEISLPFLCLDIVNS